MLPIIDIKFDQNDHGVYYSGQVISGKVEISFAKVKKVRGIAIKISGHAKAQWADRYSSTNRRRTTTRFTGREEYLSATTYLVGSSNATPTDILPGIHIYNFTCALPSFAPSSFEGTDGHIRYVTKVILDRPWKFDQTYTVGFTVLKSVDLNYDSPLLRIPSEVETTKTFWCSSKPLFLKARLPQTGFVPGQVIPIQAEINNTSRLNVIEVRFYLRKLITYRAYSPANNLKEEIINLVCKKTGNVAGQSTRKFQENVTIPAVPPTSLYHSKIIQINYDIKVAAVMAGHIDPFVTFPITIGTVPLMGESQVPMTTMEISGPHSEPSSSYFQTRGEHIQKAQNTLPVTSPVLNAPPSYEESVNMTRAQVDEEEEHSIQRNDFIPRYPVYHFEIPTAPQEFEMVEDMYNGRNEP